ncbi:MAG: hypothetical protein R6U70_03920 [Bacillota bacterium]
MAIIVVGVSVLLLGTYLAVDYVFTRYHHTRKSIVILSAEAIACLILGAVLGFGLAELAWYYHVSFTLLIALPAFSVLSLVTVETWHRLKQSDADSEVGAMRRRIQDLQDESDRLTWRIDNLERKKKHLEREHDEDLFRHRKLSNEIHRWQSGSGMERIRTMRVESWTEGLARLSLDEIAEERAKLQEQLDSDREADREEILKVKLALTELEYLRRMMEEPNQQLQALRDSLEECQARKSEIDAEIRKLDHQIRSWMQDREVSADRKIELR